MHKNNNKPKLLPIQGKSKSEIFLQQMEEKRFDSLKLKYNIIIISRYPNYLQR